MYTMKVVNTSCNIKLTVVVFNQSLFFGLIPFIRLVNQVMLVNASSVGRIFEIDL